MFDLLQETQDGAAALVRLRQHRLGGLQEHVVLRVFGHFLRHIGVTNRGLGLLYVLTGRREIRSRKVQAALDGPDCRLLIKALL